MFLKYDISVVGMRKINRALAGLERRWRQHNRTVARMGGAGGGARRAGTAIQGTERARHVVAMRNISKEAAAKERANLRAIAKAEKQEARTAHRIHRIKRRNQLRRARANRRDALRSAKAEAAARMRYARATTGFMGRSVGGAVRGVGRLAIGGLAIGGGFAISQAVGSEMRFKGGAAALANQAFGTKARAGRSRGEIQQQIQTAARGTAAVSGFDQSAVISAMGGFHALGGDVNVASELAPFFADVADATGAELADVGTTAGQIFMSALAQGMAPDEAKKAVKDIIGVVAGQAQSGAIEMRDMATQMGKLMSAAGRFKGTTADLAATMGAMGQLAIAGGASSPEEAMTALMRFASDVAQKGAGPAFGKYGVNVFADEGKTQLRDPAQIIMESVHKTGGALPALGKMFGMRSIKAVEPFRKMYVEAGGGEAGLGAMMGAFKEKQAQRMSTTEIAESAAFRREQEDKTFDIAMGDLKRKMGSELLPAITKLIPAITKLTPLFVKAAEAGVKFVGWLAENPYTGIAAIIGALVAKDIAMAGIGMLLRAALTKALLAAGLPGLAPLLGGGGAAGGAAAGAGLAKGTATLLGGGGAATLATAAAIGAGAIAAPLSVATGKANVYGRGLGAAGGSGAPTYAGETGRVFGAQEEAMGEQGAGGGRARGGGGAGGGGAAEPPKIEGNDEFQTNIASFGRATAALLAVAEKIAASGGMGPANVGSDPSNPRGPLSYRTGYEP